jgi:leader peptidase (prepilin peptidase)/N-methyltransferase
MTDLPFEWALGGVFGLLIGSFLNVCIYRWPRDLSVVRPRSACPACNAQIAWYDNVPLLGYVLLRARCRNCGAAIHWRYPVVEILTALSFGFFVYSYGPDLAGAKYCFFAAILIGLAFSDLEMRILPDELTVGGTAAGLIFAMFVPVPDSTFHSLAPLLGFQPGMRIASLGEALLGAFACSGLLWLVGWLFEKLRHKQGLGFGDVKMLAMVGAFLGLQGAILTIVVGSMVGAISGLLYIRLTSRDAASYQLPFGTFLAAAALLVAAEGPHLNAWYDRLLQ